MKQLFSIFTVTIIFAMFFAACQKQELQTAPEEQEISQEVNLITQKYLSFNTLEEFLNAQKLTYDELKNKYPDFISMQDIINMIDTADDETYQTLLQQYDNILCFDDDATPHLKIIDSDIPKLLSPEGIVKISDQIFYINDDFLKIVNYDNFDFNTLVNCTKNSDKITVIKIKDNTKVTETKTFYNNKHKLYVKKFYRNYGLWANLGTDVTHYEKTYKNRWVKDKTTITATVSWSSFSYEIVQEGAPTVYYSEGSGSKSKTKRAKSLHLTKITFWNVGIDSPPFVQNYTVTGLTVSVSSYTGVSGTF